jgi:hypothetical protein
VFAKIIWLCSIVFSIWYKSTLIGDLCTVNAAGMAVARYHWDFFEFTDRSLGTAGLAPAISHGVKVSGLSS